MIGYIVLFCLSTGLTYQTLTGLGLLGTYHLQLLSMENIYLQVLRLEICKWGIPLGVIGILLGAVGVAYLHKVEDMDKLKHIITVFYVVVTALCLI